jgi:hypothetical protein
MKHNTSFEAPSTSRLAIVHDMDKFPVKWQDRVQFSQTSFAKTIHEVLDPQILLVEIHHTIEDIERILGITGLAPSLLLGVKSLMGKTLVYDGMRVQIRETGTSFAVRSLNSERPTPVKPLEVSVQQV